MANPRAQPLQALLIGKLLEWGPEQGITLPGVSLRKPTEPYFSKDTTAAAQGFTQPTAAAAPAAAPTAPSAAATATFPPPPTGPTPNTRVDETFNTLGKQYGVPNLAEVNRAGIEGAARLEAAKSAAQLEGAQKQTATAQVPVSTPIRERISGEINSIEKQLNDETLYSPLTGKTGYVRSQIPGTPASNLGGKLEALKDLATQLYVDQLRATNPTSRINPDQIRMYRDSLGLDLKDKETLKRSLADLKQKFGGGAGYEPTPKPPSQGPFPAQAGEGSTGPRILKVTPYGEQ